MYILLFPQCSFFFFPLHLVTEVPFPCFSKVAAPTHCFGSKGNPGTALLAHKVSVPDTRRYGRGQGRVGEGSECAKTVTLLLLMAMLNRLENQRPWKRLVKITT